MGYSLLSDAFLLSLLPCLYGLFTGLISFRKGQVDLMWGCALVAVQVSTPDHSLPWTAGKYLLPRGPLCRLQGNICCGTSSSALGVCRAVSHSAPPAFSLLHVLREVPQTLLLHAASTCGGSGTAVAVPGRGQPPASSYRCHPWSPPTTKTGT